MVFVEPVRRCVVIAARHLDLGAPSREGPGFRFAEESLTDAASSVRFGDDERRDAGERIAVQERREVDPQKADECLRCHVTAFGVKKELIDPTCTYEEGVGCEACHGPGSEYRKLAIMKDHDKAVAAGLIEQTEKLCIKCHNKESPTYKPFNFEEDVKKIAHPNPKKKKAAKKK